MHLTGSYYLQWAIDPPGPVTYALAVVRCGMLPAAVLLQLYRLLTRRYSPASHLLFVAVSSTLFAEWALLGARDGRTAFFLTSVMLLLGSLSMREFSEFNYLWTNHPNRWTEAKRLQQVVSYLKAKDVKRVFSMNGLLDSQLMFYSNEKVLARWTYPISRYPAHSVEVDRALANGETVAVVGYTNTSGAPGCWDIPICTGGIEGMVANPESIFTVDDKYFVYVAPDRELLTKLGFRFWD